MSFRLPIFGETSTNTLSNNEYDSSEARSVGFMPSTAASSQLTTSAIKVNALMSAQVARYLKFDGSGTTPTVVGPDTQFNDDFNLRVVSTGAYGGYGYDELAGDGSMKTSYLYFTLKKGHYYKIFLRFLGSMPRQTEGGAQPSRTYTLAYRGDMYPVTIYTKTCVSSTTAAGVFDNIIIFENYGFGSTSFWNMTTIMSNDHDGDGQTHETYMQYKPGGIKVGENRFAITCNWTYSGGAPTYGTCVLDYSCITTDPDFAFTKSNS